MRLFYNSLNNTSIPSVTLPIVLADDATALNSPLPLDIPTYYATNNQNVHPGVIVAPNGVSWNGYKYWMGMTPYPYSSDGWENPSIVASNDKETWVVPDGLTNPIFPKPPTSHNSDPDLLFYNNTLYCYFNGVVSLDVSTNGHYVMSSSDGITWTTAEMILPYSVSGGGFSPCVLYENNGFTLYNIAQGTGLARVLRRYRCATPNGSFTLSDICTVNNFPSGLYNWHLDINQYGEKYHGFFDLGASSGGSNTVLYFATSDDGLIWDVANSPLIAPSVSGWDNGKIYRASGLYNIDTHTYDLWYSATSSTGEWFTGLTTVNFI